MSLTSFCKRQKCLKPGFFLNDQQGAMQEKTTGYFKLMDKILSFIFPMVGVGD